MLVGHLPISVEQSPSSDLYDNAALAIFNEWGIDPDSPAENDCVNPIFRSLPKGSQIYLLFSHFLTAETIWAEFYILETSELPKIQRCSPGAPGVFFNELIFAKPCRLGVCAVVNCAPNLLNVHEEKFSYLRFPIGKWRQHCGEDEDLLQAFLTTFLQVN